MGPLLPNTGNKSQAIILVEHNQVLNYANLIAGVFNDFFCHPPGTLNTLSDFSSHPSVKKITEKWHRERLSSFQPVGLALVQKTLKDLDPRKSVGVDGISSWILSLSAPAIAGEVVKLINKFIEKRDRPLELKRSKVSRICRWCNR